MNASAALAAALLLAACGGTRDPAPTTPRDVGLAELSPAVLPKPPADASNRFADDRRAAAFGQRLFFEPGLSGELLDGDNLGGAHSLGLRGEIGKVACAGCHVPTSGFSDTRSPEGQLSLAAGWGIRRAPSLLDVGQSKLIMWDGGHDSLYGQIMGPIDSEVEMNAGRLYAAERVFALHGDEYASIFGPMPPLSDPARFPPLTGNEAGCRALDASNSCTTPARGSPGDGAEYDHLAAEDQDAVTRVLVNVGKAIGAYERLLGCGSSRFDAWMSGDDAALSPSEQRGAELFVGKAKCNQCHTGPFFSDEKFHDVGLRPEKASNVFVDSGDQGALTGLAKLLDDPLNVKGRYSDGDDGRDPPSVDASYTGAFRTPKLRCSSTRPSFFHTAQSRRLVDVVQFFNAGGDVAGYPGNNELVALHLTKDEVDDLVAFLDSLDGPGPDPALLAP